MTWGNVYESLALWVVLGPAALLALLAGTAFVQRPLAERQVALASMWTSWLGLVATVAIGVVMFREGTPRGVVELGQWYALDQEHFHFKFEFVFDRLSLPFVTLSYLLCGTIAAFGSKYLHREPGFHRFFVLFAVFLLGIVIAGLAGTIELLFAGWELVGLSSALLVAFFQERAAPVMNGLRVWIVYRVADAAFLVAAVVLHRLSGGGGFAGILGSAPWPNGEAAIAGAPALFVGSLLLITAMGKSALIPFSGWLPRAMEGPTPSSAVFYGALSVHLGAYLLLRVSPLLHQSLMLSGLVVGVGLGTAILATLAARVQADIKTSLAFASLTQVGLIVAEIGLGFSWLALVHLIGHACYRTLQLVRAPTLLHDYHLMDNAVGYAHPPGPNGGEGRWPLRTQARVYRWSLERGYLDSHLQDWIAAPFLRVFRWFDRWENRWTNWLAGRASRDSETWGPVGPWGDE